jgi:hypothetical protein
MADNALAAYWELPAISRNLVTAAVLSSLACKVGLVSAYSVVHHPSYLWMIPPQIWRLVTCFLIELHPINLLMNSFFLYRYCVSLEMGNSRFPRKVDLVYYILFVCSVILVSFCLHTRALLHSYVPFSKHPSYICPDSALPLQLSRFLEMRKITPALRTAHHSHFRVGLRCRHGGMSIWMARVTPNSLEWFFSSLHLYIIAIEHFISQTRTHMSCACPEVNDVAR